MRVWGRSSTLTVGDVKNRRIDGVFVVVVIIDGVFVEMRTDQRIVTEHFVVNRVFVLSVHVECVGGFLVPLLIDRLVHLTFDAAPFRRAHVLKTSIELRTRGRKTDFERS